MQRNDAGFTLIEMIVSLAVAAALMGALYSVAQFAIGRGREAREVGAARKLIAAYISATADLDGELPAGYDRTATGVVQKDGRQIHGPASQRYPWRLLPYLGGTLTDSLFVSRNRAQVDLDDTYLVSLYPSFGMNYIFVGGDRQADGSTPFEGDCVTRLGQASYPSKLMVFATSRAKGRGGEVIEGFSILTPPSVIGRNWFGAGAYREDSSPEAYGNLDLRHRKRGVAAFLDGHVQMLTLEEFSDMRVWSARAAELDDPHYKVTRPRPAAGRGAGRY